jgi:DNA-binding GntR family transcriptional regulator
MTDTDTLIRRLIGGDQGAAARIADRARTSDEPILLVAAALLDPTRPELLARATALASSTRDRQVTAIAAAHVAGDGERVDALARDHLADHPDNLLVAWIAANNPHREGTPS